MYPRLRPFPEIDRPWVTGMYGSALADIQIDQIVDTSKDQGLLLTPSQLQINVEEMSLHRDETALSVPSEQRVLC